MNAPGFHRDRNPNPRQSHERKTYQEMKDALRLPPAFLYPARKLTHSSAFINSSFALLMNMLRTFGKPVNDVIAVAGPRRFCSAVAL